MKNLFLSIVIMIIAGCVAFVEHPITGEQIAVPPNMEDKIDFDLTLVYTSDSVVDGASGKIISQFENGGISFELSSLSPLLGTSSTEIQLGDLIREATTFVTLSVKELEKGSYTFSIVPTYGGAKAGTTQKWILIKSKEYLIEKLDVSLNPLGYYLVPEKPLLMNK